MERILLMPLAALLVLSIAMAAAWRRQKSTRNAGIVDGLWAGSLGLMAITYALGAEGWWPRRLLVGLLAGAWSLRLTLHLAHRLRSESEDGRYAILRTRWGDRFEPWMFWFFQIQAALAVLLSMAFLVPMTSEVVGWRVWDALALTLWIVSIAGELIADRQLRRWRAQPANRGRTCRAGLWRFSRHPNYFFEWLHWLVYPVLSIGLTWGWTVWAVPALMLYLVLAVTGIPPTEEQSIRSRGDDYRDYQRTTNAFFPGPTRNIESPTVEIS